MKKFILAMVIALGWQSAAMAGFAEGATAYNNKNYAVALKEIRPLAQAGNADAEHLLGLMYYMGRGVPQDYKAALEWHRKAALKGKADAQYVVGAMYYTGNAVIQDHKQAVGWFRKAAEQGHVQAQQVLGLMYRYHMGGVPQDNVIAYMLWNLAAANGSANAAEQRAQVVKTMTQEQVEEGQALSAAWKVNTPLPQKSRTGGG
ncbi:sel1 repeat family protein [Duganella sp. FT109W]|jgi:TPR repeat protein|uniref:Sel1 repeat family protein n=2 Tax=Duganella TaxID=75654 RepID=A0A7X4KKK5_9BURK|nr:MULTISPECIES: tetratricopeptide repeat protein [Duganella]MYM75758.1 sel1 repeat family protein [Duganella margarita]MYN43094.1 sel1 repeat family protein [Duganella margarita]QJD88915.1 sel1 repeat family protein [Duganella dendranthematis]